MSIARREVPRAEWRNRKYPQRVEAFGLGGDGRWILVGHGTLAANPQTRSDPLLETYFVRLGDNVRTGGPVDPVQDWDASAVRRVHVGVGLLPVLHVGQIWSGGRLQGSPEYERMRVHVVPDRARDQNTAWHAENFLGFPDGVPFSQVPVLAEHNPNRVDPLPFDLLVPWWELLRCYYANSTFLTQEVLRGFPSCTPELLYRQPPTFDGLYVLHPEFTFRDSEGHAHLRLRSRVVDSDAPTIARLCFSRVAARRALDVRHSLHKRLQENKERSRGGLSQLPLIPRVRVPFRGSTRWTVHGRWLPDHPLLPRRVFQVFWIDDCTSPLPFETLEYTRENDNSLWDEPKPEEGDERVPKVKVRPRRRAADAPVKTDDEPSVFTTLTHNVVNDDDRFSYLREKLRVRKVRRIDPLAARHERVLGDVPDEATGLSTGQGDGDEDALNDRHATSRKSREETDLRDPTSRDIRAVGLDEFDRAVRQLSVDDAQVSVQFREVGDRRAVPRGLRLPVSPLPADKASRRPPWAYVHRPTRRRRTVLLAQIRRGRRYAYACEIERRERGGGFSLVVFWTVHAQPLRDQDLNRVLQACVEVEGVWKNASLSRQIVSVIRRHPRSPRVGEPTEAYEAAVATALKSMLSDLFGPASDP